MAKENIEILNHSRHYLRQFHIQYCLLRIIVLALHVWPFYYNAEVQNNMDNFDKYLGLVQNFTYSYSRISPVLSLLQFPLSVSFFFFLLQIIPTMVIHVIVAWFLVLLLDFSFGRRVYHMPLGRLKCSRLGGTTLSWEQNESSKKKMRKCASFRGHFWLC